MNKLRSLITSDKDLAFVIRLLTQTEEISLNDYSESERKIVSEVVRCKSEYSSDFDLYDCLITQADRRLYGKFYSPKWLGQLVARLGVDEFTGSIFDPCCGTGCLLRECINYSTELGLFPHRIWGNDIDKNATDILSFIFVQWKDSLEVKTSNQSIFEPLDDFEQYDLAVLNPPFSMKWDQLNEPCYEGILAPKNYGDWAILQKSLYKAKKVVAVTSCGVWTRLGREAKIRSHFIKNNWIESLVFLPGSVFYSTDIKTCLVVFNKNKTTSNITFVDASNYFSRGTSNKNTLKEEHILNIVQTVKTGVSEIENLKVKVLPVEEVLKSDDINKDSLFAESSKVKTMTREEACQLNEEIRAARIRRNSIEDEIDALVMEIDDLFDK